MEEERIRIEEHNAQKAQEAEQEAERQRDARAKAEEEERRKYEEAARERQRQADELQAAADLKAKQLAAVRDGNRYMVRVTPYTCPCKVEFSTNVVHGKDVCKKPTEARGLYWVNKPHTIMCESCGLSWGITDPTAVICEAHGHPLKGVVL